MKRSEVVIALANIASKGKYEVTPSGAKVMNDVFEAVANLINELEAEEKHALGQVSKALCGRGEMTTTDKGDHSE